MIKNKNIEYLRNLIATDNVSDAINELRAITRDLPNLRDEVLLLSSRYEQLKRQSRLDITGVERLNQESNKIRTSLLSIIDHLPQNENLTRNKIVWILPITLAIAIISGLTFIFIREFEIVQPANNHQNSKSNSEHIDISSPVKDKEKFNFDTLNEVQPKKDGSIKFINEGKMEKTVIGNNNTIEIK